MGVMFYMIGIMGCMALWQGSNSFESDIAKLHSNWEKKSAFFGMVLNQLGLACAQLNLGMYCSIAEQPPILYRFCGLVNKRSLKL